MRQRLSESEEPLSIWDYVCNVDGLEYPAGYCAGWEELTAEVIEKRYGSLYVQEMLTAQEARRPFQTKYHRSGHSRRHDACLCFREYLLDQCLHPNNFLRREAPRVCNVPLCPEPVTGFIELGVIGRYFDLCETHLDRNGVARVFRAEDLCSLPLCVSF